MSLFAELQRRSVFKVGAAYLVVAWLVIQAASIMFPTFEAPGWALRVFIFVVMLGFPLALVLAWVFDVTPAGILQVDAGREGSWRFYAAVGAIASLAAGWYWLGQPAVRDAVDEPDARAIAVLPFVNMSEDPANEYFSDGISEEILNVLAKAPELRVAARTSSFSYKGKDQDIPRIARELGVRVVLEGSVRKQGDRVRITAQLIDAQRGFHLWSESYDRELKDIFAIQDEIARAIARELQVKLGGPATAGGSAAVVAAGASSTNSTGTTDLEAYDLYLKGLAGWQKRDGAALFEAERLFEQAAARDPRFARAWAGIALVNIVIPNFAKVDRDATGRKALAAASRAWQLDPTLAEPLAVFGFLDRRDPERWVLGLAMLKHAVQLNPSYATGHQWLGLQHQVLGDLEQAEAELEQARTLDPRSLVIRGNLASLYGVVGRYDGSKALCDEVLADAPRYTGCLATQFSNGLAQGDAAAAARWVVELAEATKPTPTARALAAEIAATIEGRGDRRALARRLAATPLDARFDPAVANFLGEIQVAHLLLWLGEPELAADRLEAAVRARLDGVYNSVWARFFDPIRCLPRFRAAVAQLGVVDPRAAEVCGTTSKVGR